MAKRDARYRLRDRAICLRCGAPGNPTFKGGQLVPMKGLKRSADHRGRQWQHADSQFCRVRIPNVRARPTSGQTLMPRPGEIR